MFKIQTRQTDGSWFDKRAKISDPTTVILFKTEREARLFMPFTRNINLAGAWRVVPA
jgi:hypothetical protein